MSDRALYVVVEGGVARITMDRWAGSEAASLLAAGPAEARSIVGAQPSEGRLLDPLAYEGGLLIDRDRRRVLHFGSYAPDAATEKAWSGWTLSRVEGAEVIAAELSARRWVIEPRDPLFDLASSPEGDAEEERRRARIDAWVPPPTDEEILALRRREEAAPPEPKGWVGMLVLLPVMISAGVLGLLGALLLLPWRRRLRLQRKAAPSSAPEGPSTDVLIERLEESEKAIARDPGDIAAWRSAAEALVALGRPRQAERELSRALDACQDGEARGALLLRRAELRQRLGLLRLAHADRVAAEVLGARIPRPTPMAWLRVQLGLFRTVVSYLAIEATWDDW